MPNNFAFTFLGRISTVALAFLSALFVTRYSSKASAGLYFWLVSTVVFLNVPISLGLNAVAAGVLARCEHANGLDYAKSLALLMVKRVLLVGAAGIGCCAALVVLLHQTGQEVTWLGQRPEWWLCAVIAAACYAFLFVAAELYRYFESVPMAVVCSGLGAGALSFLALVGSHAVGISLDALLIVGSYTAALLVVAAIVLRLLNGFLRIERDRERSLSVEGIFDFWKVCPPVMLTGIAAYAITQAHTFIAVLALGNEGSAEYNAAARLVLILGLLPGVVQSIVLPVAAKLHSKKAGPELERLMRAGATASTWAAVPLGIVFMVFPGVTMGLVFGPSYSTNSLILPLLSLGVMINTVRGFPGALLMQCGHQGIQAKATIAGGLAAGVLLLGAFAVQSDVAIASAVVIGIAFQSMLEWWISRKILGINTFLSWNFLMRPKKLIGILNAR
jgi:O-antigen/teichoic acid export membrane protein